MSLDVNISEPDEFNCIELHTCIEEVAKLRGIEEFVYHVDYACEKGENYIANIFRVLIRNEVSKISVIVKTLVNTARQELFHELHKREASVYRQVVTKFKQLQECLDEEERLVMPECLYSNMEKLNEVIILEDMLQKGFVLDIKFAKFENLEVSQVAAVMSELAKFHALSFVCKEKDLEYFTKLKSEFHDIQFQNNFLNKSKLRYYFFESYEMSVKLVTDAEAKKKLDKIKSNVVDILQMFVKPGQHNVLCHGDCWINNMLFNYEENKTTKVCFIDYQTLRYCNPATDIVYFMYLCTDSKFRSEHFKYLQSVYYESLKSFLLKYNLDVTELYPLVTFQNDIKHHLPFGLLGALVELRIITVPEEYEAILNGPRVEPESDLQEVPRAVEYLKIKVNDVVQDSIDNGLLEQLIGLINN
ncbi:uncharacterized oxidoreductase dhs-27 [Manduca sexta]|uniref:uncharacterized oxidoreductase dhs-27 n=1 Tax=Manduca sexta TaxID=7130 RepID=UPI00118253A8|nr:uncharacterized oxidoreductase dhs-27 [Manduca sexta]